MAVNKRNEFDATELQLADLAKAISHPARIAILKVLAQRNECVCGEIVEVLPLAQSTVSQHLKELLKAGLIQGTIDGSKSCYCIRWEAFEQFEQGFRTFFTQTKSFEEKRKCC
ncbi:MAG: metalloregulator ArsR/SmtB family transcription factor [Chitinophagales bacterium]|nr:metalloregulator ArsR/SmtB family transcription factor [Chitinophagales bacterium]